MNADRIQRVVARREQRRSRSAAVIVVLMLFALGLACLATESVLALLSRPALLVAPEDAVTALGRQELALPLGIGLAVLGLVFVVIALLPARRPRHLIGDERIAFIVDDDIVAGAVSRAAAKAASVPRTQVSTAVGRRRAAVTVQPTSGFAVEVEQVRTSIDDLLDRIGSRPLLKAAVRVRRDGKVAS
jgi:hypothetical protein